MVTNHPSQYVASSYSSDKYLTPRYSDPDIQHLPFFAISPAFLTSLWSSYYKRVMAFDAAAKVIISVQHNLFYVVMAFARFNLYAQSYAFLAKHAFKPARAVGGRWWWWSEIFCLCLFYIWYPAVLRGCGSFKMGLAYLLVSNIVPSPLHVQVNTRVCRS